MTNLTLTSAASIALLSLSMDASATLHDRGSGLIYDDVLHATWLQDTTFAHTSGFDTDGLMNWADAKAWAASVVVNDATRNTTWDDWRLPRVGPIDGIALKRDFATDGTSEVGYNIRATNNELPHIYYETLGNSAIHPPLPVSGPFLNIPAVWVWGQWYWTETTYPFTSAPSAYYFDFLNGMQNVSDYSNQHYTWVLRDGDVGPVPEPSSVGLMLVGMVAILRWRKSAFINSRTEF